MNRKFLIRLVPLLAIAAFAVLPAVAQGEAHYFKSNTLVPEGEKVPIISWGTLTLSPEPPVAPTTTCENAAGGFAENPVGGTAGVGATANFATWNCVNAGCPAGKVKIGEAEYEKQFVVSSETLPWPNVLIEEAGIRTENTGVQVALACVAQGSKRGAPGAPGEKEAIYLAAPTICVTTAEKKQKPLNVPGKNSTVTSKVLFDKEAGALSCAGGAVAGKTSGTLKVMAYKESEVITTK